MKRQYLCAALLILAPFGRIAMADFGALALAGRAGTLGFGGELMGNILPDLNGRFGVTYFPLDTEGDFDDINYDFDLKVLTFPLTLDWYPFHGGFHISGGLIFNQTDVGLDARANGSLTIGENTYSAAELGTVRGEVEFRRVAPYVGIGWGNAFGKEGRWGIVSDLGVAFLGRPSVSLSATGPVASDPTFMGDLAQEEKEVEDDLRILRFYPVFSISLFYRF